MSARKTPTQSRRKTPVARRRPARKKLAEQPALDRALADVWQRWRAACLEQPSESLAIRINRQALQRMWIDRLAGWSYAYEPVLLEQIAGALARRRPLTGEQLEYLKDLKNRGDDLRGFFQLFSVAHEIPRAIQALVKCVGQIRDQVRLGQTERARAQAKELRALLARTARARWPEFQVEPAAMAAFLRQKLRDMRQCLAGNPLSAHAFHQFKKDFRLLFSVHDYLHPDPARLTPAENAFSATRRAVKEMHQVLLAGKYLKSLRYREFRVNLPEEFRRNALRLLRSVTIAT